MDQILKKDNNLEDYVAVEKLKQGDEIAFEVLFEKYYEVIYFYSKSLVKIEAQAEEVVQDVFYKVWSARESLDPGLSFKAFIFTIARNLCFNFLKKAAAEKERTRVVFYESQRVCRPSDYDLVDSEYKKLGLLAVDTLPPRCQLIYRMSRDQGKSNKEISEELGISISTVKSQMNKALGNIRNYLESHGDFVFFLFIYSHL